jgi:alpha-L-fucosidase
MAARFLAALCLALGLTGCASSSPRSPEEALTRLIEDAVSGRAASDQYQNVDPVDEDTIKQFVYVEEWLDVNGESVVGVRPGAVPVEGSFRFTRSADGRSTYLISYGWPGPQVRSRVLRPAPGSKIMLLGWSDLLPWEQLGAVCVITTPREMADEENHPCKQAFVFKVEAPR